MPLLKKDYSQLITHSRSTTSSRWNEFGQFEVVPANTPCIDHDPSSLSISESFIKVGFGDKTFATTSVYTVGDVVQASVSSGVFVRGRVKSSVAGSLTLEVVAVGGSGTYNSWTLIRVRGLGVWEQRTNLLLNSEDFWRNGSPFRISVNLNFAVAPGGAASAARLFANTAGKNGFHSVGAGTTEAGAAYVVYVAAKRDSGRFRLSWGRGDGLERQHIDCDTYLRTTSAASSPYLVDRGVQSAGDGYDIYWLSAILPTVTTGAFGFAFDTPEQREAVIAWGGVQKGSFPTPHIPTPATFVSRATTATYFDANGVLQTAAANVARDNHHVYIDGAWRKAGLLLEGQATNLLPNSGPENSTNGVVSGGSITGAMPTGWSVANGLSGVVCEIVGSGAEKGMRFVDLKFSGQQTAGGFFNIQFGSAKGLLSGTEYTFSIYLRKISGTSNPTFFFIGGVGSWGTGGAYVYPDLASNEPSRVVASRTLTASGTAYPRLGISFSAGQIDFTARIYEAQLEAGPVATSPIPTSGSQVTRAADVSTSAQVTRAGDPPYVPISESWFNAAEGCIYVEFECDGSRSSVTAHNAFALKNSSPGALLIRAIRGSADKYPVGVFSQSGQLTAATAGTAQAGRERVAICWKGSVGRFARNGQLSAEFALDPIQAQLLALGVSDSLNVHHLNGWISTLRSYMRRPTDAELQTLTTIGYIPGKDT